MPSFSARQLRVSGQITQSGLRGVHTVAWTPPARGTYRVRLSAKGPSGPRGSASEEVRVVEPRKRSKKAQPPSTPGTAPLRKASTKRR